MKRLFAILSLMTLLPGCSWLSKDFEEPSYTLTGKAESDERIEFRHYSQAIMAEVTATGDRDRAARAGFKLLADYIFGNNGTKDSMDMTAPVTQQQTELQKPAMTAPVSQQASGENSWKIRFFMPTQYSMESLPKPNNTRVTLIQIPPYDAAIIAFSGSWREANFLKHEKILSTYLHENNIQTQGAPVYAYYDPPFMPWFLKRNEVIYKINHSQNRMSE